MKKEKIDTIKASDGERVVRCGKRGCILTTPYFKLEMKKVKGGYILKNN